MHVSSLLNSTRLIAAQEATVSQGLANLLLFCDYRHHDSSRSFHFDAGKHARFVDDPSIRFVSSAASRG